jgi:hypothetical protein
VHILTRAQVRAIFLYMDTNYIEVTALLRKMRAEALACIPQTVAYELEKPIGHTNVWIRATYMGDSQWEYRINGILFKLQQFESALLLADLSKLTPTT